MHRFSHWLCLLVIPMLGCDRFFYYPNRVRYGAPEELNLACENVRFPTQDGSMLHGYWLPAQRAPQTAAARYGHHTERAAPGVDDKTLSVRGTVLHLHGNAGNVSGHFQHVAWLPAAGWNVLAFDYRGYGLSEGKVTRAGTIADAHAALDFLLNRPDVDAQRIVAFGQSLGGAVGIVLTAERGEIRGLATDGAFDSYRRIVAWHVRRNPLLLCGAWWFPLLMRDDGCDPIDYVARIAPRPLLIIHGTADRVVDPRMARRLYEAAGEPKELWLIEGIDHYGALQDHADHVQARLLTFYDRCLARAATRPEASSRPHER